jgi:hypothetical protein
VYKAIDETNKKSKPVTRNSFAIGKRPPTGDGIDRRFSLRKAMLGDDQIEAVCKCFMNENVRSYCGVQLNWTTIILERNKLTDKSAEILATLVEAYPSLQTMDLSQNSLT